MARTKIREFWVVQKAIAGATVTFYEVDSNGENTNVVATIYQESSGVGQRSNPQVLDDDGKLPVECWVEDEILAAFTDLPTRTERSLKKIRENPLEYALNATNAALGVSSVDASEAIAVAAAATATTQAGIATTGATTATTQAGISTTAASTATTAANDAETAKDAAELAASMLPLNNYAAMAAPTVNDDSGDGYAQGSKWIDNSASPKEAYMCVDASVGAAVWVITTLSSDDLGTAAFDDTGDFATAAQGLLAAAAFNSVRVIEVTATGAGTYTPTTGTVAFIAEWIGAGGGGGARVTNSGSAGGDTTFDSIVAPGGAGGTFGGSGSTTVGGAGGTGGSGSADVSVDGGGGMVSTGYSSPGGTNPLFPSQGCTTSADGNAVAGRTGCGGGGGNSNAGSTYSGGGGGAGRYRKKAYYGALAGSYSYTIGTGGAGGTAGAIAGGAGGDGYLRITEFVKG